MPAAPGSAGHGKLGSNAHRRHAGNDCYLRWACLLQDGQSFQDQTGHAVNPWVAAGNDVQNPFEG